MSRQINELLEIFLSTVQFRYSLVTNLSKDVISVTLQSKVMHLKEFGSCQRPFLVLKSVNK